MSETTKEDPCERDKKVPDVVDAVRDDDRQLREALEIISRLPIKGGRRE